MNPTLPTPEQETALIEQYEQFVNPALASVLKFIGYDSVEWYARGCTVTDSRGRDFLDCLGGFGTMSVGHSHPRVMEAVRAQLDRMAFSSRVLFPSGQGPLAEKLAGITPGDLHYSFFCNSGTEATEGAVKLARMATGRSRLISAHGAFHGKTLGGLSVSGREGYKTPFQPLVPDCLQVPYNDIAAMEATLDAQVAAVILEPIQGEGGIVVPGDEYLRAVRELCDGCGALLIADEVQTGLGRTGKMWGCDWSAIAPDIMLLAKALSGSCLPVGAIVGTPRVWEIWSDNPLIHSSTFGGNPLACATALAAIEVIEGEGLAAAALERGQQLESLLREVQAEHPTLIREVRGRGLMLGVEFTHPDIGGLVISGLATRQVLAAYTFNNPTVIRFEPPLVITEAEVRQAGDAFTEAVAQTAALLEGVDLTDEGGSS